MLCVSRLVRSQDGQSGLGVSVSAYLDEMQKIQDELVKQLKVALVDRDQWRKRALAQENCEHYVELPPQAGEGPWMICEHMNGSGLLERLSSLEAMTRPTVLVVLREALLANRARKQPGAFTAAGEWDPRPLWAALDALEQENNG